jgi:uncharacterized membrane protein YdcZ (DUF606 family)
MVRLRLNSQLSKQDQQLVLKLVISLMYGIVIFASIANLLDGLTSTWQFLLKDVLPNFWSLYNAAP